MKKLEEEFKDGKYHSEALVRIIGKDDVKNILKSLEMKHYNALKKAALNAIDLEILSQEERKLAAKILRILKRKPRIVYKPTPKGTVCFEEYEITDAIELGTSSTSNLSPSYRLVEYRHNLEEKLKLSGVVLRFHFHRERRYIILAPYLEESFIRQLEEGDEKTICVEHKQVKIDPQSESLGQDVLEGIVASVLRAMGYRVKRRIHIDNVEVDVYATRYVNGYEFRVWVECKNWKNEIGVAEVRKYAGDISSAPKKPHVAIFVASNMSDEAIAEADKHGIFTVILGEQITQANKEWALNHIKNVFQKLLVTV